MPLITFIYVFANVAYFTVLSASQLLQSNAVAVVSTRLIRVTIVINQSINALLPCVADADIILSSCGFLFLLFSSPNLSSRRVDVYRTSTHGVALARSEMCCTQLAGNTGRRNDA